MNNLRSNPDPASFRRSVRRWPWLAAVGLLLLAASAWADDATPAASPPHPSMVVADTTPPVDVLCRAAVAMALAEPERARGFVSRARIAGWLPEFHFRIFRRFARTEGLTLDDTAATVPLDVSAVDDVRYEWRATWDLSRMVFNPDELHAHAEALRMSDVRRDIQSLVVRLYFERRRLLTGGGSEDRRAAPSDPGADDERRHLRALEIEAQLDAITGGAFSRSGPMTRPPPRPDARREQRKAIDVKATVEVNGRAVSVRTRDISRSGMCLVSDSQIATNTTLDIQLVLSLGTEKMSEPLWVAGSAVWCTALFGRYQVGVMFVDLDDEQARFLDLFMRFIDGDVRPAGYDPGPDPKPERPEDKDDPFRP